MAVLREFLWIAVLGGIAGFLYGFLIGANDVANAFASSVSSKSITLKQAVLIASIFEFSGAFFLGASVTGTIRNKIVSVSLYEDEPEVLMFGMFTSLVAANVMLYIATHFGIPVSTTHDIVGCIMGFSIAAKGFDSIEWDVAVKIFISWIVSPLFAGSVGFCIFGTVKYGVLRSSDPYKRAYWTFPIVLTCGIGINVFYVLYKASSNFKGFQEDLSLSWVLPTSFGAGAFCGLIWLFGIGPIAKRRVEALQAKNAQVEEFAPGVATKQIEDDGKEIFADDVDVEEPDTTQAPIDVDEDDEDQEVAKESAVETAVVPVKGRFAAAAQRFADATYNQDLHEQSMHENARTAEVWDNGEKFDVNTENLFTYLQVFTACLNSFAHGANDVSNTIAPLSAILQIYKDGAVSKNAKVQKWVLAYGGIAIVLGLLLYGYRVMKSIGFKLTLMSPSRGFSAELSASLVVVTASFLEIPVSSTQCIVGAVFGVGLVGGFQNVQWMFLLKVMCSWAGLFIVATILSAGIFSFGAFSPSLV